MQRMTLPLPAERPGFSSLVSWPASNGSFPLSIIVSARLVVIPMPRPSTFIHFTQRRATSLASKPCESSSDSPSSRAIAASSSYGEFLGGGARSSTPFGKAWRMASGVPRCSVGTPSWLPATRPSNAPRAREISCASAPPRFIGPQVNTRHGDRRRNRGGLRRPRSRAVGDAGEDHVSGAAVAPPGSTEDSRLRGAHRNTDARRNEGGWMVFGGGRAAHTRSPLVLWERRNHRRDLADHPRLSAAKRDA